MELLYLWIDRYNNILNQGFNFSNEYNFSFDVETNTLQVKALKKKELNLFNESFLNITAIIGKNGSGKSSIFSVFKELFSEDFYHHNKFLMVTKGIDGRLFFHKKEFNDHNKFVIQNTDNIDINEFDSKSKIFDLVDLILNSNSFSVYNEFSLGNRYFDLTLNNFLYEHSIESNRQLINQFEETIEYWKENDLSDKDLELQKIRLCNGIIPQNLLYDITLRQQVDFITKYSDKKFDFVPTELNLSFNKSFITNNLDQLKEEGLGNLVEKIEYLLFVDNPMISNPEKVIIKFKDQITIFLFLSIFVNRFFYQIKNFNKEKIIDELTNADLYQIPGKIKMILTEIEVISNRSECYKLKEVLSSLDKNIENIKFVYRNINSYTIFIDESAKVFLNDITDYWQGPENIFKHWWRGLSAGQSAILTLFAKFYYASKFIYDRTVWILLDEGELYLHPEWQRKFFYDLHKYLPLFFKGKRIQLFLTSHSPFLVSDLPSDNVLLLDVDENDNSRQVDKDKFNNTFGANINELLASSFFLDQGFVGEFAKEKINDLFIYLNYKEPKGKWTSKTALELIELIGEPIVKRTLLQLYDQKFNANREIQFLESEIKKLKNKDKNNDKNKS